MREGYTLVWVGWQFDVAPPLLRIEAPAVERHRPRSTGHVSFTNEPRTDATLNDLPGVPRRSIRTTRRPR